MKCLIIVLMIHYRSGVILTREFVGMLELLNERLLDLLEFQDLSLKSTDESFAHVDAVEVRRGGVDVGVGVGVGGRHLI